MKWERLVQKKDEKVYLEKLAEISDVLLKNTGEGKGNSNISLMGGKTGVALFFFYYAQLTMEEKYVDFAHELITEIFESINKEISIHTFAGGLAGVGWMMEHLVQNDFVDADTDEILQTLDTHLHKAMISDIKNGNYDFLHGAVGNGIYFLSRLDKKESKDYLKELVDHLDKNSHQKKDDKITWESVLDHEKGTRGYNLSLSHGISSIIVFLGKMVEKGIYIEKVSRLLNGAVNYLLSHQLDTGKFLSNFPSWIREGDPIGHSRLAWCYGDLGIGAALLQAARAAGNKEWEQKALDVLQHTTGRRDVKENMVLDAGLCHGAAGMAHIYNRLYHYTDFDVFRESALYWLDHTKKMAVHTDGYAGYKAWHTEKYGGWVAEAGLLEGIAGIGLMLISMVSDIEPKWDRSLFLS